MGVGHNHGKNTVVKSKNILFAALLNISFTVFEIIGGLLTNSVAILSDALHDFGDSIALLTSYIAEKQSENRPPDAKRTFGYARLSLFSAVFNAVVLIVGSVFILWEAVQRLTAPEPVHATGMLAIAAVGVVVNSVAYLRLRKGESTNEHVLTWHLLEDVVGWIAVLVGAIIIYLTDFFLIDPILTVGYTLFILWGVSRSLLETGNLLMQGVPRNVDLDEVTATLMNVPGVSSVHDIHVWSLDGVRNVFTGHLVVSDSETNWVELKQRVHEKLKSHAIDHVTLELETVNDCVGYTHSGANNH